MVTMRLQCIHHGGSPSPELPKVGTIPSPAEVQLDICCCFHGGATTPVKRFGLLKPMEPDLFKAPTPTNACQHQICSISPPWRFLALGLIVGEGCTEGSAQGVPGSWKMTIEMLTIVWSVKCIQVIYIPLIYVLSLFQVIICLNFDSKFDHSSY